MISTIVWIVLAIHVYPVHSSCGSKTIGAEDCIAIGRYSKYQYGTCLTDAYIQQKSNHKHQCEDRTATFCHYQCMLELYDVNLETLSCKELGQSYALDYGEKFCNLYTDHYASFDDVGKKWVNAVRKCLQVALVPRMRSFNTVPCEQIKDEAFASHTGCYVTPPDDARSFCDIGYKNVFRVMGTIKSALIQFGTIWRTISQGFSTVVACMNRDDKDSLADKSNMMQVKGQIQEGQNVYNTAQMRFDIESAVSAHMGEGVFVYAFPELPDSRTRRSPENSTVIITNVLVLPRAEYDLNYHKNDTVNVTNIVDGFLDGLADGSVKLSLPWPIQDIRQCDGVECEHSTRIFVIFVPKITEPADETNKADGHTSIFVIIGAIVGVCAVVIIAITILAWLKDVLCCRK